MNHEERCRYAVEEILGGCWHGDYFTSFDSFSDYSVCGKCNERAGSNPPFTTANEIKLLTDKMRETPDMLRRFNLWAADYALMKYIHDWLKAEPISQLALIVDFWKENKP